MPFGSKRCCWTFTTSCCKVCPGFLSIYSLLWKSDLLLFVSTSPVWEVDEEVSVSPCLSNNQWSLGNHQEKGMLLENASLNISLTLILFINREWERNQLTRHKSLNFGQEKHENITISLLLYMRNTLVIKTICSLSINERVYVRRDQTENLRCHLIQWNQPSLKRN